MKKGDLHQCEMDIYARWALIEGVEYPITNFYDANGDETDDPDKAVRCVAGVNYSDTPGQGIWFNMSIEQEERGYIQ